MVWPQINQFKKRNKDERLSLIHPPSKSSFNWAKASRQQPCQSFHLLWKAGCVHMRKWKGISPGTSQESLNGSHGPCKSSRSCILKIIVCFIYFGCACSRSRDQTCVSLQADSLPVSQQRSPRFTHSRMEWASPFRRICKESLNKLQMNGWPICLLRTLA